MNLGFFAPQTPFDRSISNISSYFQTDQLFLEALKRAFIGRASLEKDYLASLSIIVQSLTKQLENVQNPLIKSSVYYICQDWNNLIEQSSKLVKDYEFIANQELKPRLEQQQDFVDTLKANLKSLKQRSNLKMEEYRRIERNFAKSRQEYDFQTSSRNQMKDQNLINHLVKTQKRDNENLCRISKQLLDERKKNISVIKKTVENIENNQAVLGDFLVDLGMKNFILQVNYLKNREYDISQLIESFKKEHNNKFNYDESENKVNVQGSNNLPKFKFPVKIELPNKEFMQGLDQKFYKNIHYDLLNDDKTQNSNQIRVSHKMHNGSDIQKNYKNFGDEVVILSRLFDNKKLTNIEQSIIKNLYLKEKPEIFIYDFFKSFMKFKKASIYIKEDSMQFFILDITEKIFLEFIKLRNYEPIFQLIKILQFIKIYTNSNVLNASQPNWDKERAPDVNYNMLSSQDFKPWITDKNNFIQHSLSYKNFWVYCLSQIFSKLETNDPGLRKNVSPNSRYVPNKSNFVNNQKGHFPNTMNKPRQIVNSFSINQLKPNMNSLNRQTSNDNKFYNGKNI
jgi:hypothetical protein